jgi:hypothetical protein
VNKPSEYYLEARFLSAVQVSRLGEWHAIDAAAVARLGCEEHDWAVCGAPVLAAIPDFQPWNPQAYPARYGACQQCLWRVAALTDAADGDGDMDARMAAVAALVPDGDTLEGLLLSAPAAPMLANLTAAVILTRACKDERDPDDPETIQLLVKVAEHAPVLVVGEACEEGDCEHQGRCPGRAVCPSCSLRAGSWADEYDGAYLPECTIVSPCAPLLSIARHFGVTGAS